MSNPNICVNLGDTFLLDTPPNGKHLFVAIAPLTDTKFLFVSLTTKNNSSDLSCVINKGAGVPDFVEQTSVIYYNKPREIEIKTIQELVNQNEWVSKGRFSPNILYKIQIGATISDRIPRKYEKIVKEYLGIT